MDAVLHLGFEHPSLLWIVVASVAAFVLGLAVQYRGSDRTRASNTDDASADADAKDAS